MSFAVGWERVVTQIDDTHFKIKHLSDSSQDINIEMIDDGDGNIEWLGLTDA